jgi:hypothetical protein
MLGQTTLASVTLVLVALLNHLLPTARRSVPVARLALRISSPTHSAATTISPRNGCRHPCSSSQTIARASGVTLGLFLTELF